jgi:UDP-glucose:(heptosyl)LPS alpha-1,3-glucosyltransferase
MRYYPETGPKISIVPNGVDTDVFNPENRRSDRKKLQKAFHIPHKYGIVLFVATNFYLKGLDIAVDTLSKMDDVAMVVVGGDNPKPYMEQAKRLGMADRIHYAGFQSSLAQYYRSADVLFYPTRYDPFANVCLEAMSCGTPVVTTEWNGVSDLLVCGFGGHVVSPADPDAMAHAVQLILDQGEHQRMAAREIAVKNNQNNHVSKVVDIYKQMEPF